MVKKYLVEINDAFDNASSDEFWDGWFESHGAVFVDSRSYDSMFTKTMVDKLEDANLLHSFLPKEKEQLFSDEISADEKFSLLGYKNLTVIEGFERSAIFEDCDDYEWINELSDYLSGENFVSLQVFEVLDDDSLESVEYNPFCYHRSEFTPTDEFLDDQIAHLINDEDEVYVESNIYNLDEMKLGRYKLWNKWKLWLKFTIRSMKELVTMRFGTNGLKIMELFF